MNEVEELRERVRLTPTEIGDALDLEKEGRYPCSDGSRTWTISVDVLIEAQLNKVLNDPGLRLFDGETELPHTGGWHPRIIPLTEALKEVKE